MTVTDTIALINLVCTVVITTIAILAFRSRDKDNDEHTERKP